MGLTLRTPPGFADLADAALVHDSPAFAINVAKIYENACFGVGRTEFFQGFYKNGDQVPLPTSRIDGRPYARTDLLYIWFVRNSTDPQSLWITGADSLFYCNWLVDQATGNVFCDEWYRRSGSHADVTHTNDGKLEVWTIAQRQMSDLIVASSPTYSAITGSTIAQDKPFTELMAQALNRNAKFAALNHEVHYLGEYYNGQTVTMPTSSADGHVFTSSECKFHFSWRWTAVGNSSSLVRPPLGYGQMGPLKASVNSSGVVSVSVDMIDDSGNLNVLTNLGRIAVFAFCKRSGTPGTITPAAVNFAEISFDEFMPGSFLEFPNVQQIIKNIEQALLSPEYFGPTTYANGDTIPVPTSTVDGYVYSRSELQYIPVWSDTSNQTGSNLRLPLFFGSVDPNTGVVTLHVWRLPPGGAYVDDDDALARISVMVVARRQAAAPASVSPPTTSTPGDVATPGQVDLPNGSALQVNGVAIPSPETGNFNDSTPAAPTGERNVKFQMDALSPTQISGHVPNVGGVDPRTTVTESIGLASQGKLVTLNNASAVAVSLDSTAGGGGGGSPTVDVLSWIAIPFADRTTRHLVGAGVYAANWMDADGQKLWLIKNSAGNPWDIYTYDSSFVYHWITENADEGTWSSANAWKRFLTPVPVMPRFFNTSGPPVTTITNGSNPIQRTTACGTDGEPLINIGTTNEVLSYSASESIGGDVGTQPALILTHSYGHQREQFYYCQGFGLVKWTHANLSGGVYVVDQTTLHNTWVAGGCPTPNFPCYATVLAAGNWIGGAPGSGGNVANPSSSPPTTSGVPSSFFCAVKNKGAGTATLTPTSGTIDGAANLTLLTGQAAWLFFDGTNWTSEGLNTFALKVNGSAIASASTANLSDSTPAAATGMRNAKWQKDALSPTDISAEFPNIGGVDARTTTTETVALSSQGKLVTVNNASSIAVTLDSTVSSAFFCAAGNLGAGIATLTPSSGTINGGASLTLSNNQAAWLFFDGTNWQAVLLGSGISGSSWSGLTNPTGNLSLSMGSNTSLFTYGATTGSSDLFNLTDTTNNTGTGALVAISKASGSTAIPLRLKQLSNGTTQPLLRLENSSAAAVLELHVNDIGGFANNRIEATGAPFILTRGGTAASNKLIQFSDTGTSKWLGTITSNFDGVTSSEIGLTLNNIQTMSGTSTAAVLSVQNNGTRLLDVSPAATNVKSGAFIVATAHTPSSSSDTGVTGQIAWDSSFIYICVATNTWKRVAIATF